MIQSASQAVGATTYPGRGIIVGKSADGKRAVMAYFIMGRSVNSRNRVFVEQPGGIRTQAFDPSKMEDPSLIIYAPVRTIGERVIVTNGDQTDTIYDFIGDGSTFEAALMTREFEPDAPNYTPRISALLTFREGGFGYRMSILKSDEGNPVSCLRYTYDYASPMPGSGRFIHTYRGDGSPLPSFTGEPVSVAIREDLPQFTERLWDALDKDNRVSLFTRSIDLLTLASESRIVNRHEG